jgi:ribosomal protein S18 acetylase RimI-like enzyme
MIPPDGSEPEHGMDHGNVADIRWASDATEIMELGALFAHVAATLPDYISHGEVQCGLSGDGVTWSARAPELINADFERISQGRRSARVAGAWLADRTPVAVAVVDLVERDRVRYAVLCDLLVEKDRRHTGIGERMVRFIEAEMRMERVDWIFLESGIRNERAHRFFEKLEYSEMSRIFAKRL